MYGLFKTIRPLSRMLSLAFSMVIVLSCFAHNATGQDVSSGQKAEKSIYLAAVVQANNASTSSVKDPFSKSPFTGQWSKVISFRLVLPAISIPETLLVSWYERNLFYIHTTINAP